MRQIAAPTAVASVSPSSASLNPNASEFVSTRTPTAEQSGVEASPATPATTPVTAPATTPVTTTSTAPAVSPAVTTATPAATTATPAATPAATTATPVGTFGTPATITQAATPAVSTPAAATPQVVTPVTPAPLPMVQSVDESMPSTSAMPAVAQPGPSSMTASVAPTMKRYSFFVFELDH